MNDTVKTPKGTTLPLLNLKGKPYLMVAHRLMWFNEEVKNFEFSTEFLVLTDDQTVARTTVTVKDEKGNVIKKTTATKRETKKDFPDHTEKAESSSLGRAIAMMGFGTQFAIADLDEGERLADSPVTDVRKTTTKTSEKSNTVMSPSLTQVATTPGLTVTNPIKTGTAGPTINVAATQPSISRTSVTGMTGGTVSSFRKDKMNGAAATTATNGLATKPASTKGGW